MIKVQVASATAFEVLDPGLTLFDRNTTDGQNWEREHLRQEYRAQVSRISLANFAELQRTARENIDFIRDVVPRQSGTIIIAPHGGALEFETSEAASVLAGDRHSYYSLRKLEGSEANVYLTSARFDDPVCLAMVKAANVVVSVHGCINYGARDEVWIGGQSEALKAEAGERIRKCGLKAVGDWYNPGKSRNNIVNKGRGDDESKHSLQLEFPAALRRDLQSYRISLAGNGIPDIEVLKRECPAFAVLKELHLMLDQYEP